MTHALELIVQSYEGRQVERSHSRNEGFRAYQYIDESLFGSPRRRMSWNGCVQERYSLARSESRSPVRWTGHPRNSGNNFREYDEYPFSHRGHESKLIARSLLKTSTRSAS